MREVLTALPRETNYACVRPSVRLALGIDTIDNPQPLAFVPEHEVRYRQDLLTRFVPDACGIQVLTAEHLERVPDQSAWKVTELSHNRYLVEHRDLSAWYANTLPGEEVRTAARADFAPILLTREVSRANPAPW